MLLAVTLALGQWIMPIPAVAEVGGEVRVVARDAAGGPLAGIAVTLRDPAGTVRELGRTGAGGELTFAPAQPGDHALEAAPAGLPRLLAPLQVVPGQPRRLAAWICVPLGLALLVWNVRRLRRGGAATRSAS